MQTTCIIAPADDGRQLHGFTISSADEGEGLQDRYWTPAAKENGLNQQAPAHSNPVTLSCSCHTRRTAQHVQHCIAAVQVCRVAVVRMFCMSFTDTFVYTCVHCVCVPACLPACLDKKCSVSIIFFLQAGCLHFEGHRQVAGRISRITSVACKACVSVLPKQLFLDTQLQ